jgi:hypothetical protein
VSSESEVLRGTVKPAWAKVRDEGHSEKQAATYKTAAFQGSKLGVPRRED